MMNSGIVWARCCLHWSTLLQEFGDLPNGMVMEGWQGRERWERRSEKVVDKSAIQAQALGTVIQ